MLPTILMTRPENDSLRFADQLRARIGCGVPIMIAPIMRIEPVGAMADLTDVGHLIFSSRNGVNTFAERSERRDIPCYAVGDATAQAARAVGLVATSCCGAADDLVARITADKISGPCLHIRGEHGAGDIAKRLTAAGINTNVAVLYRQVPEALSPAAQALLSETKPVLLPLFSPRTARLLFSDLNFNAPLWIAALSENVINAVPNQGKHRVLVAQRSDANAMLDAIEMLLAQGKSLEGGKLAQ